MDNTTAIQAALRNDTSRSDRDIAREVGVDHKTVGRHRSRLEESGEIPPRRDNEVSDEEKALRENMDEINELLANIEKEKRAAQAEIAEIEEKLLSDPNIPPSEILEKNRGLNKRFRKLSLSISDIESPKKSLEARRAKIEAKLFEYERDRAMEAHNADMIRLYRLVLELNSKVETVNALIQQITELSRVKLDERYRAGVQPGRVLKSAIAAANFIPAELKAIKISNEDMLKEAIAS